MNDQSVTSIPDLFLGVVGPAQISPWMCPWCGDLQGCETEIVPVLVVDEHGEVVGVLVDAWCCTGCGHEWDEPAGVLR